MPLLLAWVSIPFSDSITSSWEYPHVGVWSYRRLWLLSKSYFCVYMDFPSVSPTSLYIYIYIVCVCVCVCRRGVLQDGEYVDIEMKAILPKFRKKNYVWRTPSSGMWRHVVLVRIDDSAENIASIMRVKTISKLWATLAITSKWCTLRVFRLSVFELLVTANVVPS
jgi:hypothetical protein